MKLKFTKTPDEQIAEILSRYSVLDLIEQTEESLDAAEAKFAKYGHDISVVESGQKNLIHYWKVLSNGELYEVRRFEKFVWCSCKDFFFTKQTCKHLFTTTKTFTRARANEMDSAPYLKQTPQARPIEKVGNIRV